MKIILMAVVASMLLAGIVAAEDVINLSTIGKKPVIETYEITPVEIKYMPEDTTTVSNIEPVDVRSVGRSFGTFAATSEEPVVLGGSKPITYTLSFAVSQSNVTSSTTSVYTPSFAVGNNIRFTPPIMLFGGA